MFQDFTIRQIGIYVSIIFCVLNLLFLQSVDYFFELNIKAIVFLYVFVGSIVISLLAIRLILEKYLLQKIKLIYRVIHSSKLDHTKRDESVFTKNSTFESVDEEVAKWAEVQQAEIATLKSLETYRKNYVGNISHELKTPLFSVQGYIHTLLDGGLYDENVNKKYLERAASNLDRLNTIVEDLETINRLEEGISLLEMEKFDIRQLFTEVIHELEVSGKYQKSTIEFKDKVTTPVMVEGDVSNIYRVINNLLVNSMKYGNKNGTTKIGFYDMGDTYLIEVSDNGIGIEEKHLNHLFDRFYRVDASRSRKIGGSGLGLSIVKHIIEAHNQTITVRSTLGIGSTFGFTLAKA